MVQYFFFLIPHTSIELHKSTRFHECPLLFRRILMNVYYVLRVLSLSELVVQWWLNMRNSLLISIMVMLSRHFHENRRGQLDLLGAEWRRGGRAHYPSQEQTFELASKAFDRRGVKEGKELKGRILCEQRHGDMKQ